MKIELEDGTVYPSFAKYAISHIKGLDGKCNLKEYTIDTNEVLNKLFQTIDILGDRIEQLENPPKQMTDDKIRDLRAQTGGLLGTGLGGNLPKFMGPQEQQLAQQEALNGNKH